MEGAELSHAGTGLERAECIRCCFRRSHNRAPGLGGRWTFGKFHDPNRCFQGRKNDMKGKSNLSNAVSPINKTIKTGRNLFEVRISHPSQAAAAMRPRRPLRPELFEIVLATTSLVLFSACKEKPQAKSPPAPMVEVATVSQADVPIYHEWIGVLDGLVNAQIRAQVTGYLLTQTYREGDTIKKGDLLFEIDPRPFKAVLDQANGQLAQAEARLGKTELDVKRYAPLVKDKAVSQEEYDDAVQANLEAKAAVLSAKAQVEQAQLNLEFTRIVSPIDGIASIAKGQIGDLVGPGTGELTTVSTIDPIKAYYNVTEQAYINFAKLFADESKRQERLKQLEIQLILADGTVYPHLGIIYAPDRQIGQTTGALRLEARFPNPDKTLRPGEFVRVLVKFDTRPAALLVPQRA